MKPAYPLTKMTAAALVPLLAVTTAAWSSPSINVPETDIPAETRRAFFPPLKPPIPAHLGTVSETYFSGETDVPFIFHIEDAHSNLSAQRNIKDILHHLASSEKVGLLLVEGTVERLDPAKVRFFRDDSLNRKAAGHLLEKGILSGAELFLLEHEAAENSLVITAPGIEDAELYRDNLAYYRAVSEKEESAAFLEAFKTQINTAASSVFNKPLKDFFREWAFYQDVPDELLRHINVLAKAAREGPGVDLSDPREQGDWPQLARWSALQGIEPEGGEEKARAEFEVLISLLGRAGIDKAEIELLMPGGHLKNFEKRNLRPLFERFHGIAAPNGFRFEDYPALGRLWAKSVLEDELDAAALLAEAEEMTRLIFEALVRTDRERILVSLYADYLLLKKLLELKLSPGEYESLLKRRETLTPAALLGKLHSVRSLPPVESRGAEKLFSEALRFYETAAARDRALFENVLKKLGESGKTKAVLVTGGFHSPGLRKLFKEHGVSFAGITPRIQDPGDSAPYEDIVMMKGFAAAENSHVPAPHLQDPGMPEEYRPFYEAAVDDVLHSIRHETGAAPLSELRAAADRTAEDRVRKLLGYDELMSVFTKAGVNPAGRRDTRLGRHLSSAVSAADMPYVWEALQFPDGRETFLLSAGTGQGIWEIWLAHLDPKLKIRGIESDPALFFDSVKLLEAAEESGYILPGQVEFIKGDFTQPEHAPLFEKADIVYYFELGTDAPDKLRDVIASNLRPGARVVTYGKDELGRMLLGTGNFEVPAEYVRRYSSVRVLSRRGAASGAPERSELRAADDPQGKGVRDIRLAVLEAAARGHYAAYQDALGKDPDYSRTRQYALLLLTPGRPFGVPILLPSFFGSRDGGRLLSEKEASDSDLRNALYHFDALKPGEGQAKLAESMAELLIRKAAEGEDLSGWYGRVSRIAGFSLPEEALDRARVVLERAGRLPHYAAAFPPDYKAAIGHAFPQLLQRLDAARFLIREGMGYGDRDTFWNRKTRLESHGEIAHSGTDLGIFLSADGAIETAADLSARGREFEVPAFLPGSVHRIFKDNMAYTAIVKSGDYFMVYTHMTPREGLKTGDEIAAGEILGKVQFSEENFTAPHLHLGLAVIPAAEDRAALKDLGAEDPAYNMYPVLNEWQREGRILYLNVLDFLPPEDRVRMFIEKSAAASPIRNILISGPKARRKAMRKKIVLGFPGLTGIYEEAAPEENAAEERVPFGPDVRVSPAGEKTWKLETDNYESGPAAAAELVRILKEIEQSRLLGKTREYSYPRSELRAAPEAALSGGVSDERSAAAPLPYGVVETFGISRDSVKETVSIEKVKDLPGTEMMALPSTGAHPLDVAYSRPPFAYTARNQDGKLVGYRAAAVHGRRFYAYAAAVLPEYQKNGVYSRLFAASLKDGLAAGLTKGYVTVEMEGRASRMHEYFMKRGALVTGIGLLYHEELDGLSSGSDEMIEEEAEVSRRLKELNRLPLERRNEAVSELISQYRSARLELEFDLREMLEAAGDKSGAGKDEKIREASALRVFPEDAERAELRSAFSEDPARTLIRERAEQLALILDLSADAQEISLMNHLGDGESFKLMVVNQDDGDFKADVFSAEGKKTGEVQFTVEPGRLEINLFVPFSMGGSRYEGSKMAQTITAWIVLNAYLLGVRVENEGTQSIPLIQIYRKYFAEEIADGGRFRPLPPDPYAPEISKHLLLFRENGPGVEERMSLAPAGEGVYRVVSAEYGKLSAGESIRVDSRGAVTKSAGGPVLGTLKKYASTVKVTGRPKRDAVVPALFGMQAESFLYSGARSELRGDNAAAVFPAEASARGLAAEILEQSDGRLEYLARDVYRNGQASARVMEEIENLLGEGHPAWRQFKDLLGREAEREKMLRRHQTRHPLAPENFLGHRLQAFIYAMNDQLQHAFQEAFPLEGFPLCSNMSIAAKRILLQEFGGSIKAEIYHGKFKYERPYGGWHEWLVLTDSRGRRYYASFTDGQFLDAPEDVRIPLVYSSAEASYQIADKDYIDWYLGRSGPVSGLQRWAAYPVFIPLPEGPLAAVLEESAGMILESRAVERKTWALEKLLKSASRYFPGIAERSELRKAEVRDIAAVSILAGRMIPEPLRGSKLYSELWDHVVSRAAPRKEFSAAAMKPEITERAALLRALAIKTPALLFDGEGVGVVSAGGKSRELMLAFLAYLETLAARDETGTYKRAFVLAGTEARVFNKKVLAASFGEEGLSRLSRVVRIEPDDFGRVLRRENAKEKRVSGSGISSSLPEDEAAPVSDLFGELVAALESGGTAGGPGISIVDAAEALIVRQNLLNKLAWELKAAEKLKDPAERAAYIRKFFEQFPALSVDLNPDGSVSLSVEQVAAMLSTMRAAYQAQAASA